jgi:hypothetical protein
MDYNIRSLKDLVMFFKGSTMYMFFKGTIMYI